jgi:hypothetical protein
MRTQLVIAFLIALLANSISFSQNYPSNIGIGPKFYGGALLGYNGGFSIQLNGTISDFAKSLPLAARFGIGYTTTDAGKPAEARKVFINNATNGIPEESGLIWDFRMDLLYNIKLFSIRKSFLFAGVRYSMFTANFKFIGGNEFFDITTDQWGLGGGVESYFALGSNLDLVITAGADYYFSGTISGHDTAYSPDGENINPREDYTYEDADNSVNQPKFLPRVMVGFNYAF